MKQNFPNNRSKLPCIRSTGFVSNPRGYTMTSFHGSTSQGGNQKISNERPMNLPMTCERNCSSGASHKEISDCLSNWLSYLQTLNGLCSAGNRLATSIRSLIQDTSSPCHTMAVQCQIAWDEMMKSTTAATGIVKNHVLTAIQELNLTEGKENDSLTQSSLENTQVVCSSLVSFINIQYQICLSFCEILGAISSSSCCPTSSEVAQNKHDADCCIGIVQQCFSHLQASPIIPVVRSPLHFPLYSVAEGSPQRRWSEAAAAEMVGESSDGMMRRWSMPWENSRAGLNSRLQVPCSAGQDKSRSTTPDSMWQSSFASQEELQEVIQLLSLRPSSSKSTALCHASQHLPGVTLTNCSYDHSVQDQWTDDSSGSQRGSCSPQHRTSETVTLWQGMSSYSTEGNNDLSIQISRKSSSSTDSSSNQSLAAGAETGENKTTSHLYSMWNGSDVPFIKFPCDTKTRTSQQPSPN